MWGWGLTCYCSRRFSTRWRHDGGGDVVRAEGGGGDVGGTDWFIPRSQLSHPVSGREERRGRDTGPGSIGLVSKKTPRPQALKAACGLAQAGWHDLQIKLMNKSGIPTKLHPLTTEIISSSSSNSNRRRRRKTRKKRNSSFCKFIYFNLKLRKKFKKTYRSCLLCGCRQGCEPVHHHALNAGIQKKGSWPTAANFLAGTQYLAAAANFLIAMIFVNWKQWKIIPGHCI